MNRRDRRYFQLEPSITEYRGTQYPAYSLVLYRNGALSRDYPILPRDEEIKRAVERAMLGIETLLSKQRAKDPDTQASAALMAIHVTNLVRAELCRYQCEEFDARVAVMRTLYPLEDK